MAAPAAQRGLGGERGSGMRFARDTGGAAELRSALQWGPAGAMAKPWQRVLLAAVLLTLLLLNTALIWHWRVAQLETDDLKLRRTELTQALVQQVTPGPRTEAQSRWLAEKNRALNHPWPRLFERLEARLPRSVQLHSLRAEQASGELLLSARAPTPEALLQWAAWLGAEPELRELKVVRLLNQSADAETMAELQLQLRFVPQTGESR